MGVCLIHIVNNRLFRQFKQHWSLQLKGSVK